MGREVVVGGADVDVDGVGVGVSGSVGGEEEATRCRTALRKTNDLF